MLLAARTNGLIGDGIKPWHLKATYTLLDEKGNVTDQGTYEEFWAAPVKYKLIFANRAGSRTEYGTDSGVLNSDNETPVNTHDIRHQLLLPMPPANRIENADLTLRHDIVEGEKLNCVKAANGNFSGFTYCLDAQTPALRAEAIGNEQILRKNIISFQGHYIAGDMQLLYGDQASVVVHLDSIEALTTIDEAIFTPPSNAVPQNVEAPHS